MRKKIFTAIILSLGIFGYANAQYNLFDAADVDADGWIWFDTQAKIDKYISQADNENLKFNESGKIIQLVSADFGEYVDTEAAADFAGAGTDGALGGANAKTGAIKIAPSSASMSTNGGGVIVKAPSCTSFNLMVSASSTMYVRLLGTTEAGKRFTDYTIVSALYSSMFKPLSSAGQFTWLNMQTLNSGNEPIFTLASSSAIYGYFQNLTKNNLYIHGLKVLTSTPPSNIDGTENDSAGLKFDGKTISLANDADIVVYNTQGIVVKSAYTSSLDVSGLANGIYIAKAGACTQKVIVDN
ncbi:T9SS type A sorting domain-containing protein [Viscerimonas tarda]